METVSLCTVQWTAKVMTPSSMYFLWKQVHDFWDPLYAKKHGRPDSFKTIFLVSRSW